MSVHCSLVFKILFLLSENFVLYYSPHISLLLITTIIILANIFKYFDVFKTTLQCIVTARHLHFADEKTGTGRLNHPSSESNLQFGSR